MAASINKKFNFQFTKKYIESKTCILKNKMIVLYFQLKILNMASFLKRHGIYIKYYETLAFLNIIDKWW